MKGQITLSREQFKEMHETVEKLDSLIETIEIISNKKLIKSIKRSADDIKKGRTKKLEDLNEIKKW